MPISPLAAATATAADYADAMFAARRVRNVIFLTLLTALVLQMAIFFLLRSEPELIAAASGTATTRPTANTLNVIYLLSYLTNAIDFTAIVLIVVFSFVLLLIVNIMLVGRLIGVSQVTTAYIRCIVLGVLLFPWQAILVNPSREASPGAKVIGPPSVEWKIPGVLSTWTELTHPEQGAGFGKSDAPGSVSREATFLILKWARFVGFPCAALVLLLSIQLKSSRGLQLALGEIEHDPRQELS